MTHELWENLNATVYAYLSSVKLSHLVENQTMRPIAIAKSSKSAKPTLGARSATMV